MFEAVRVLIVGDGNSARSQIAEGLLRHEGGSKFEVYSAGSHLRPIHPEAVAAMHEIGIDISHHQSKLVDEFAGESFEFVVTVCESARERCPYFAGWAERVDWSIDDPTTIEGDASERLASMRRVRDAIHDKLAAFFGPFAGGS